MRNHKGVLYSWVYLLEDMPLQLLTAPPLSPTAATHPQPALFAAAAQACTAAAVLAAASEEAVVAASGAAMPAGDGGGGGAAASTLRELLCCSCSSLHPSHSCPSLLILNSAAAFCI